MSETKPSRFQRLWQWRPLLAYAVILLIAVGLVYSAVANYYVQRYVERKERDPETGIMLGYETIEHNREVTARAALLVHGFIGAPDNYGRLTEVIAEAGWRVEAMLLPGHGRTPYRHERTTYEEYRDGVLARLDALRDECETVVLFGHSMGGALAALVAADAQPEGLVLIAPFLGMTASRTGDAIVRGLTAAATPVIRWLPAPTPPINDPAGIGKTSRYDWVSTAAALEAMHVARRVWETEAWKEFTMPTLVIHSRRDEVTHPQPTEEFFPRIASDTKELLWLDRSNHVYMWDYDAEEVEQAVLAFLERWPA